MKCPRTMSLLPSVTAVPPIIGGGRGGTLESDMGDAFHFDLCLHRLNVLDFYIDTR